MTPGTDISVVDKQRDLVAFLNDQKFHQELAVALPEGVSPARFARALQTALLENQDVLQANRVSLYKALLKAAGDNLIPDGKEAAFVVYKGNVGYLPMIQGVRKKLAEFGWTLRTGVIWENDSVAEYSETDGLLRIDPARLGMEKGARIGAWAKAIHNRGEHPTEVLIYSYQEIEDVRKKSSQTDKFWLKWPNQMWEKTVAHRLAKKLPLDPRDKERIDRMLDDIEGSAVDLVYGRGTATEPPSPRRALPGAEERDDPSTSSAPPPTGEQRSSETGDGAAAATADDEPLQEPTDEELDAMSEPEQQTINGEVVDESEARFEEGKHQGRTIQEVYDEGPRGQNYVRWAVGHWKTEPMRTALQKWADEHGMSV